MDEVSYRLDQLLMTLQIQSIQIKIINEKLTVM